jgi:hypothetical protein
MGRRPIGDQPMTATERQRRWRQGLRQRAARPTVTDRRPTPMPSRSSRISPASAMLPAGIVSSPVSSATRPSGASCPDPRWSTATSRSAGARSAPGAATPKRKWSWSDRCSTGPSCAPHASRQTARLSLQRPAPGAETRRRKAAERGVRRSSEFHQMSESPRPDPHSEIALGNFPSRIWPPKAIDI